MSITRTELEQTRRFDHFHDGVRSPEIHPRHAALDGSIRKRLLWLIKKTYKLEGAEYQYSNIAIETLESLDYTQADTCTLNGVWGTGLAHSLVAMEVTPINRESGGNGNYFTDVFASDANAVRLDADYEGDVVFTLHYDDAGGTLTIESGTDYDLTGLTVTKLQLEITCTNSAVAQAKLFSYAFMWD